MKECREIEKSIVKKFRKEIWTKFVKAVNDYDLIKENDKIAVCISGGKDSVLLAKCLQELQRHGQFKFDLEFISMNPGYNEVNTALINRNVLQLGIPLITFHTDIFDIIDKHGGKSPCYLCARMRRGYLYSKAKELGCNKIALAHHFNDVIETIMMNLLYNGKFGTMMPKLKSDNFEGMSLIRPLYYVKEEDIISWSTYNSLNFIQCGCSVTEKKTVGKRVEVKELIKNLVETNENADINIFNASKNVNLNTVINYSKDGKNTNFLDTYGEDI